MPAVACQQPATPAIARAYRRRRSAATLLHELVRTNLETWLATAAERDDYGRGVPLHVEAALRNYLRCGILAHGFARVYCGNCRHDFLVAFSCKGRDLCPSCATRRMVDVSAHMVDQVLPGVQHRQWVLSISRRVRWHLRHRACAREGAQAVACGADSAARWRFGAGPLTFGGLAGDTQGVSGAIASD